jgi:hypothetical protein
MLTPQKLAASGTAGGKLSGGEDSACAEGALVLRRLRH